MSVYTTQVRWIIESGGSLALSQYPIFDESYRAALNKKIQDHFYFREIGFETVGLFNNRLAARMNEIMPYYNELYKSTLLITNPTINRLYKESFTRHNKGTTERSQSEAASDTDNVKGSSSSTGSGTKGSNESRSETENEQTSQQSQTIGSDTPQGLLSTEDVFEDSTWASQASAGKGSGSRDSTGSTQLQSSENTSQQTSTSSSEDRSHKRSLDAYGTDESDHWETFERSLSGLEGTSQAALVTEFRQSLLNIDMMIIEALEDLFMQIW